MKTTSNGKVVRPMSFGEKLKELRLREELSQEQFAERLNVSRSAVAKWEAGAGIPETENLLVIAREFSVSLDWLLSVNQETYRLHSSKPTIRIEVSYE
jgi:transcriptional regulator with XRE-family HTH domain